MKWDTIAKQIKTEIIPNESRILKSDGDERRLVVSNDGKEIGMRTGVETETVHTISYEMIRFAFEAVSKTGKFDSSDFRRQFKAEYKAATCRYTMTGGILVELGIAKRITTEKTVAIMCVGRHEKASFQSRIRGRVSTDMR